MGNILTHNDILALVAGEPPLVEGFVDLAPQLQNNGFDLTLRSLSGFSSQGQLGFYNDERILPQVKELAFDADEFVFLPPGQYHMVYNEIVHLPKNIAALGFPRSSLLRSGTDIRTAAWDAGYSGRSESLLLVHNPHGMRLKRNARLLQLVFFNLCGESDGYHGSYQGENI